MLEVKSPTSKSADTIRILSSSPFGVGKSRRCFNNEQSLLGVDSNANAMIGQVGNVRSKDKAPKVWTATTKTLVTPTKTRSKRENRPSANIGFPSWNSSWCWERALSVRTVRSPARAAGVASQRGYLKRGIRRSGSGQSTSWYFINETRSLASPIAHDGWFPRLRFVVSDELRKNRKRGIVGYSIGKNRPGGAG